MPPPTSLSLSLPRAEAAQTLSLPRAEAAQTLSLPRFAGEGGRRRRPGGGRFMQSAIDHLQNAGKIAIDIDIPKTKNAKARFSQPRIALNIACGVVIKIMLAAINLDNKPMFQANKIDDISFARRLTAKVKPALSPGPQVHPDLHLLRRHRFAQVSCDLISHSPHPARHSLRSFLATLPLSGEG